MLHSQGHSNIPIQSWINPVPHIDIYIFKIHSNLFRFNHSDYIRWMVQTIKFLIPEPSPLPIPLGPNICLRILFLNTLIQHSSLNIKNHVSEPHSPTGNIIVLFIYFFFSNSSKEIKVCRLKAGNSCYFSVQTLLPSQLLRIWKLKKYINNNIASYAI